MGKKSDGVWKEAEHFGWAPVLHPFNRIGLRRLSITRHLSAASGYKGSLQRTSDSDMSVVGSWYLESLTNLITNHPDKKKVPAVSV